MLRILTLIVATLAIACVASRTTAAGPPAPSASKITQAEARAVALAAVPGGTVQSAELERENGRLVWSFDLTTPGSQTVTEVLVAARSGQVVSKKVETPAEQAQEAKADSRRQH